MNPKISIILPFYNISDYLDEAIISIKSQSFKEFELLLINDGSTDKSLSIANSHASNDDRIKILSHENRGLAYSLNRGVDEAKCNYIARMDGDDICHPKRLEMQYDTITQMSEKSLVSSTIEPFSSSKITEGSERYFKWLNNKCSHEEICAGLYKESPLIHPSVMFTKDSFYSAGKYKEYDGPEDYDLWLRMAENGTSFLKIKKSLLKYRIHNNNLSRNDMYHYSKESFRKQQYKHLLHNLSHKKLAPFNTLAICGFAKEGKRLFNYLKENNILINHFVDVSKKKVGLNFKGVEVLPVKTIKADNNIFYLCAIGSWKSEDMLIDFLTERGLRPLDNYLIL